MANTAQDKYYYASGRRKTSVATVRLFEGKSDNIINDKKIEEVYPLVNDKFELLSPLRVTDCIGDFYFTARSNGGGKTGQRDAIKLALAKALVKFSEEHRPTLRANGLLTRDPRMVERKKPGLKKARKSPQFSKR